MAFEKEASTTPTAIADIEICMYNPDPTGTEQPGVSFNVQVRYSDGSIKVRSGNLVPHLTQTQINQLQAFMATMRTKAIAEML